MLLTEETILPVYFAVETEEVADIYRHVRLSANSKISDY